MYKPFLYTLLIACAAFSSACRSTQNHFSDADIDYMRVTASTDSLGTNAEVEAMIEPYRKEMEAQMDAILGELPVDLVKDRPNSTMGNWFCDAVLHMANIYSAKPVDFALQNYGGLRIPFLGKGPVTKSNIYEMMPFDNQLIILELNADVLLTLLNDIADSGGWPLSEGITFRIEDDKATDIEIGGKPVDPSKKYIVAMPDYIANGWGGQDYLEQCESFNTNVYVRDAVIDYLYMLKEDNKDLTVDQTKRIN